MPIAHRTPTPIVDRRERVIGLCAGCPDDPSWGKTKDDAADGVEDARKLCRFPSGSTAHRRGQFPALAVGASFGGGQQVGRLPDDNTISTESNIADKIIYLRATGGEVDASSALAPKIGPLGLVCTSPASSL